MLPEPMNLGDSNAISEYFVNFMLVQQLALTNWDRLLLGDPILFLLFRRLNQVFNLHGILTITLFEPLTLRFGYHVNA
jgi:hypothetical protein